MHLCSPLYPREFLVNSDQFHEVEPEALTQVSLKKIPYPGRLADHKF